MHPDELDEPTPLKLLGAHLVQELEMLRSFGFSGDRVGAFRVKDVEVSIPFASPPGVEPTPIEIGGEEPLTAVEAIDRLTRVESLAFIRAGRLADAPADSIAVLRLRMKL